MPQPEFSIAELKTIKETLEQRRNELMNEWNDDLSDDQLSLLAKVTSMIDSDEQCKSNIKRITEFITNKFVIKFQINCNEAFGFAFIKEEERQEILTELQKTNTIYEFNKPTNAGDLIIIDANLKPTQEIARHELPERSKAMQRNFAQWKEKNPHATIIYLLNTYRQTENPPSFDNFCLYGGMHTYNAIYRIYVLFQDKIGIADHPTKAHLLK